MKDNHTGSKPPLQVVTQSRLVTIVFHKVISLYRRLCVSIIPSHISCTSEYIMSGVDVPRMSLSQQSAIKCTVMFALHRDFYRCSGIQFELSNGKNHIGSSKKKCENRHKMQLRSYHIDH